MPSPTREYQYKKVFPGTRVGRLTVSHVVGRSKNGSKIWRCTCDCGKETEVISSSLNSGLCQSCGCLYESVKGRQKITHGKSYSKTYNSWLGMKQRCYYRKHPEYNRYGGKGVEVCTRWRNSFENFLADMGDRPVGMSIDRIDGQGNYTPENCRWATPSLQGYNTKRTSKNKSGRTGVSWHKATNKWIASITYEGNQYHLGVFESFKDAVDVRESAEIRYFGYIKEIL